MNREAYSLNPLVIVFNGESRRETPVGNASAVSCHKVIIIRGKVTSKLDAVKVVLCLSKIKSLYTIEKNDSSLYHHMCGIYSRHTVL